MADLTKTPLLAQQPNANKRPHVLLAEALHMHSMGQHGMIPAQVLEFNRTTNQATVQPMIMFSDQANNISRPKAANIPVISLGGGGFHISFPLKKGDLGWILAADRDISQFVQSLKESPANTTRHRSFGDAWFVPDVFRNYTINAADVNAMVLQSTDGTTRISIQSGQITITAPTKVVVNTPLAAFSTNVTIGGTLTVTGMAIVNGGLNASGSGSNAITLPSQTTIGGITVATHGHISSNPGTRTSGNMIA